MAIRDPRPLSYIERAAGVFFCKQNPGQSSPGKTLKILPQNVSETGGRRGGDSTKFQRVFTARNGKDLLTKVK